MVAFALIGSPAVRPPSHEAAPEDHGAGVALIARIAFPGVRQTLPGAFQIALGTLDLGLDFGQPALQSRFPVPPPLLPFNDFRLTVLIRCALTRGFRGRLR